MKIAVITSRFPYPLEKGDKLRLYNHIKHLSQEHIVYLFSIAADKTRQEDIDHVSELVEELYVYKQSLLSKIKNLLIHGWRMPFQVAYYYNKNIRRNVEMLIKDKQCDLVYNHLVRTAEYSLEIEDLPKVMDYMDAFSVGMKKRAEGCRIPLKLLYNLEASKMKKYERKIYTAYQSHILISKIDAQHIGSDLNFKIVKNGVDMEHFSKDSRSKRFEIGFVGNMGYLPNVIAVKYMVKEIMPLLSKEYKLLIAGARPAPVLKKMADDRVYVTGYLEDIRNAYCAIKILVAPIFKGTGMQNKILEAMASGIPVVTSSIVNESIGATPGKEIFIADDPERYVEIIEYLLNDSNLYKQISENAINFVGSTYSWEIQNKKLEKIINEFRYRGDKS